MGNLTKTEEFYLKPWKNGLDLFRVKYSDRFFSYNNLLDFNYNMGNSSKSYKIAFNLFGEIISQLYSFKTLSPLY